MSGATQKNGYNLRCCIGISRSIGIRNWACKSNATSELIAQTLQQLPGMVVERLDGNRRSRDTSRRREGGTVAFRADMDALPVQEQTECAWRSQNDGVMHACGHDGHGPCCSGLRVYWPRNGEQMAGTVRFIFQPAEEIGAGAKELIAAGALQGVNRILGAHLDVLHPTRKFWDQKRTDHGSGPYLSD